MTARRFAFFAALAFFLMFAAGNVVQLVPEVSVTSESICHRVNQNLQQGECGNNDEIVSSVGRNTIGVIHAPNCRNGY